MLSALVALSLAAAPEAPPAPAAETLYVQASSVNIRETADPKGTLVATAACGVACTRVEAKGDWVKVACPFGTGFSKAEFFGPRLPDRAALKASLEDRKAKGSARVQAGQRLLALSPDDVSGFDFRAAFAAAEAERLPDIQKHRKPRRTIDLSFGPNVSDHQAATEYQITSALTAPRHDLSGGFAWLGQALVGIDAYADGALRVILCTVENEGGMMSQVLVWDDAVNPADPLVVKQFQSSQDATNTACRPKLLDAAGLAAASSAKCPLDASVVTQHSACQLKCSNSCNSCRGKCGVEKDSRGSCTTACEIDRAGCAALCAPKGLCPAK